MKYLRNIILFLVMTFAVGINLPASLARFDQAHEAQALDLTSTDEPQYLATAAPTVQPTLAPLVINPTPTPSPTPDEFSQLYNCQMELRFTSGPLDTRSTEFTVLGRDYFQDKGDLFAMGAGTGIFYEAQRYFILHSAYINNPLPQQMEAEFLRRYLENWGNHGPGHIQTKIDELIGSQAVWICDGIEVFSTEISGIARLSHEASNRLWLQPHELTDIIIDREGDPAEWIGDVPLTDNETIFLGFCGWGPPSVTSGRFVYYRYLISFEVLE